MHQKDRETCKPNGPFLLPHCESLAHASPENMITFSDESQMHFSQTRLKGQLKGTIEVDTNQVNSFRTVQRVETCCACSIHICINHPNNEEEQKKPKSKEHEDMLKIC